MAFYQMEPWGSRVEDLRAGVVAATVANVNRDPQARREPYHAADFAPDREPTRPQTPEEQLAIAKQWAAAFASRGR